MKLDHFPKKHPGKRYIEKGERTLNFGPALPAPPLIESENLSVNEQQDIETSCAGDLVADASVQAVKKQQSESNNNLVITDVSNSDIMVQIVKLKELVEKNLKLGPKNVNMTDTKEVYEDNVKEKLQLIQSSQTVVDLCMKAGLTLFESTGKLICDTCSHDELVDAMGQNTGVFSYDVIKNGADFIGKSQPREFRNLKTKVVAHYSSNFHLNMSKQLIEKHKKDESDELFNYKIGMGRARQIYQNVKDKCSYEKYESDCLVSALNGENIGNINHSRKFAQQLVAEIGAIIQMDLKAYFKTPLECTGQLPPVGLSTDKMTQKRHTNHLAVFITPDVQAPLSDSFLKPVYVGMPIVSKHAGVDIAEQILNIAEKFLDDLDEQLQAFNNDGQYFGLNLSKHVFELRENLKNRVEFIVFNWDPSHRNALADKDARKEHKEDKSYFNEVLDTVQWVFKNIGYGKHYEEYLMLCDELDIDPRAPITFSDTRFPQFSYNTLRNFLQVYIGLVKQLKAEDVAKKGKDLAVSRNLKAIKSKSFVVTLAGATDVYRREQILSQQCQKIDQHVFEVYDNLKIQKEKLEQMLTNLTDGADFSDWTIDNVENLDKHLWANLKVTCLDLFRNDTFRGEVLDDYGKRSRVTRQSTLDELVITESGGACSPGIVKALNSIQSYLNSLIRALETRFENEFEDSFVHDIKEVLDLSFMLQFAENLENSSETYENCLAQIKEYGVDGLRNICKRLDKNKDIDEAEFTKMEEQYFQFKRFSLELIADVNMTKEKQAIKDAAITESVDCYVCHRRFEVTRFLKHFNSSHGDLEDVQFGDKLKQFSSMKVLHGVCQFSKYFQNMQMFIQLALKLACKTPNEAVVESVGSMLNKHMRADRPGSQISFDCEMHIDWNGPVVSKANTLLERALDNKFGSRKRWNFKSGNSKFYVSKVVDRKKLEHSPLSFIN